jgi:hypothetical protein
MEDGSKHEDGSANCHLGKANEVLSNKRGIGHHRGAGPPTAAPVKSDPNSLRISAQTFAIGMWRWLGLFTQGKSDFDHIQAYRADPFFGFSLKIGQVLSLPTIRQRLD